MLLQFKSFSNPNVRFDKDESGSMTILALFFFICMVLIGGISIDIMVFENNRARLQSLSDRAVLAAADLDQTVPATDVVNSYFAKAGMQQYLGDIEVNQNVNQRSVKVNTAKVQRTMFMNFWNHTGIDTLTPRSVSAATEARSDLEISLVLDVSGSMAWASSAPGSVSKLADLKSAAKRFVDKIYTTDSPERITMNLVPYSTQVNAGPVIMNELGVTPRHAYSNCINFADADFDSSVLRGPDAFGVSPYKQTMHFDQWYTNSTPRLYVCRPESALIVKPVLNDPDQIKQDIDALTADGNTSIEIGLKWGAAFIDPSTRNITQRLIAEGDVNNIFNDRPFDWDRPNAEKFIVLLTDGVNTEQQQINDAYATGPSGMWRWVPNPARSNVYYSWESPEVGDEDGDGIANERYWNPRFTLPRSVTGLSNITIPAGWSNDRLGDNLGALNWRLPAALPNAIAPVQLDFAELWNEMPVRRFAETWVRGQRNSYSARNTFYANAWEGVNPSTKDANLLNLCSELRDKGATIFTIGFEVTNHSANVMGQCASTPNYFIRVVGNDLEAAFDQIANSISKLRLTQ